MITNNFIQWLQIITFETIVFNNYNYNSLKMITFDDYK